MKLMSQPDGWPEPLPNGDRNLPGKLSPSCVTNCPYPATGQSRRLSFAGVQTVGQGRTLAWASDIGPHWCPEPFATWEGYARLWSQAVAWLAGRL